MANISILWQTTDYPTHEEQLRLRMSPPHRVNRAAIHREIDEGVSTYELLAVAFHRLPSEKSSEFLDAAELASSGRVKLSKATEQVTIVPADRIVATYLQIPDSSRVLKLDRVLFAINSEPVEWRVAFVRQPDSWVP
jgi:DNA-binding GntR family transcriptional regulator